VIFAFHLSQGLFLKMTNDNCFILSKDRNSLEDPSWKVSKQLNLKVMYLGGL